MKVVLVVGGSDTCSGAGIQQDLKACSANGVYATTVISCITVQNTGGVKYAKALSRELFIDQLNCILEDINIDAVKIGVLYGLDNIKAVSEFLKINQLKNVVLDPIIYSSSGKDLVGDIDILIKELLPKAYLITPNIKEAEIIYEQLFKLNKKINNVDDMIEVASAIKEHTKNNVLLKGGHLVDDASDVLVLSDSSIRIFSGDKLEFKDTHGSGCTLSSCIASNLAKGKNLEEAIMLAKKFTASAIANSLKIGKGQEITNTLYKEII